MSQIEFDSNVTLFIGDNGQGKTNIIEAVYLAITGKSFRPGKPDLFVKKGTHQAFIELNIIHNQLKESLKCEINNNKKSVYLNNKRVSAPKIQARFPVVLFSPESLSAIKEGPELRRNLVDELLISHNPKNSGLLADFNNCLRNRNKLLKNRLAEKILESEFSDVLTSLDQSFLPLAAKVTTERISALKNIENDFCTATQFILDIPNTKVSVDYIISSQSALQFGDKEVYYALLNRQRELLSAEKDSGMTLFGPQRHDIQFLFDQLDAKYYCSQGQQRTLILAFKMAQMMYHCRVHKSYPLLLLDDVLSELDPTKRNLLISYLKQLDTQILLTTTDLEFPIAFGSEKLTVYKVNQGDIIKNGE